MKILPLFLLVSSILDAQLTQHTLSNLFDNVTESTIGDIDGDGDMDIFFAFNGLKWYEQIDADLNEWTLHQMVGSSGKLELLDVDNDGDLDFVVHDNGQLKYYENLNSIGTEITLHVVFEFTSLSTWEVTSLVDLDSDGDLDFVSDGFAWAENIDGYFNFAEEQLIYEVPAEHSVSPRLNFVDWDGNSELDIIANVEVIGNEDISQILLIKNLGNGNFSTPEILIDSIICYNRAYTRVADLDFDNDFDIVIHRGPDDLVWFRNDESIFSGPILIIEFYDIPGDMEVVDMNNDGLLDIFWCGHGGVFWKPNLGDFSFASSPIQLGPPQINEATNKITFGDLDQDGDLDMLRMGREISDQPQKFSWYENTFPITTLNITQCESYTSPSGNNTWTESGTYLDTLVDVSGEDSLIVIVLDIHEINTNLIISDHTLICFVPDAEYQWLNCDNEFAPISSANEQFYMPSESGNYAVQITVEGCIDTTSCINISFIDEDNDGFYVFEDCDDTNPEINPEAIEIPNNGIDEDCVDGDLIEVSIYEHNNNLVSVYPNPATDKIIVENLDLITDDFSISLYSLNGHLVKTLKAKNNKEIFIENLQPGLYFLVFQNSENKFTTPLIKVNG